MKTPLRIFIARKKVALKSANPKSRDRIRHRLNVLKVCQLLKGKRAA